MTKYLIVIMLAGIGLILISINESIIEGNLSEAEKTSIAIQKEAVKLEKSKEAEQREIANAKLLATPFDKVTSKEMPDWIIVQASNSRTFKTTLISLLMLSLMFSFFRKAKL